MTNALTHEDAITLVTLDVLARDDTRWVLARYRMNLRHAMLANRPGATVDSIRPALTAHMEHVTQLRDTYRPEYL